MIRPLADEIVAAAWRDGIHVRVEDVRSLLLRERPPSSPEEHVLLNSHELLGDLDRYGHREITQGLIEETYERLVDRVGPFEAFPYERPLVAVDTPYSDPEVALRMITRMARGEHMDPFVHPLFASASISQLFWDFRPLPRCNALVALQIRRLFFRKLGYPVLVYLPMDTLWRAWEDGTLRPPQVSHRFLEVDPDCGEGIDLTPHYSTFLELLVNELHRFEEVVAEQRADDDRVFVILRDDTSINDRQRAVLDEAIRRPEREFTIDGHRRFYGLAYATARKDLLGLQEAGFLEYAKRGQAFVFHAVRDLQSRIEARSREPKAASAQASAPLAS